MVIRTYIATDSQIPRDILNGQAQSRANQSVVHLARELVTGMRTSRKVIIFWIAGHAGIEGNEIADKLANVGTERSRAGHGMEEIGSFVNYCI